MKTLHNITRTIFIPTLLVMSVGSVSAAEPVWDANKVTLVSEKLADGVYAYYSSEAKAKEVKGLPVATSGGFVIGSDGVLLIDTMLNERLNKQVQQLVREVTDKPIRHAVNTSFHGDHSYGNMYLPAATNIIQHVNAKAYIDQHFKADTEFMMQNFGKGRGIEQIVPTTGDTLIPESGKLTIDLGGKVVQIIDFGFAQTGGDLFVWEPQSKTLWAGNPIITVKPSLPWLLDGHLLETLATLNKVYDFLPEDAKVIPGHGSMMSKQDIKWHIDYLATVKEQVQSAIDQGLTLAQTVAKVTMTKFTGYALFGWVHPALNVPAAYKDLNKLK
ncbi:MAG: MBL fold metallo-hydrolase [Colwellia sp.]|nr:MBL fold metallo-hydrolase [Colwellia sp.]